MVIKASSSKQIDTLVGDLASESAVKRDAAIARLTVIGSRAVDRLVAISSNPRSPTPARLAAFRALEAIAEPRALPSALAAFTDPELSIVVAALNTARAFLRTARGVDALDRVIEIALDRRRQVAVRIAAIQALAALPNATMAPIFAALNTDPDPEIANALQPPARRAALNTVQRLEAAAAGTLPAEPDLLKSAIARSANAVPLAALQRIVERIRVQEGAEPADRRAGWMAARAAAHLALAQRDSRLALYDLRETMESLRERIAVEFFAAVTAIGDTTCLEPIAAAYSRVEDDWSRRHLADAFRAIVGREQITKRHAVARKIEKRWPGIWQSLAAGR